MKKFGFLLLAPLVLCAQQTYSVTKSTALSSSAEVITVQQPASGSLTVNFVSAYIDSTAACSFTIERNGTAATSTPLTPAPVNYNQASATTTGWSGSNVGTGTVITNAGIAAGGGVVIDLSRIVMQGNGTYKNLTLRTASCTATVNIVIVYTER